MLDTSASSMLSSEYLDRWAAAHLSCEPADRATAEEGVRLAYATAGLAPPQRIVWCGGPLEIAKHLAAASPADAIGANVKAEIFDQVQKQGRHVRRGLLEGGGGRSHRSSPATTRVGAAVDDYNRCKTVSAAVNRLVRNAANDCLSAAQGPRQTCGAQTARLASPPAAMRASMRWPSVRTISPRSASTSISMTSSPGRSRRSRCAACGRSPRAPAGSSRMSTCAGSPSAPAFSAPTPEARLHCADGPALQYRGRLVGLRLERRPGPRVDDRAPRTDHALDACRHLRAGPAQLHDRDHDAGALHQERRASTRRGGRDRHSLAQALGLSRRDRRIVDRRRGRERHRRRTTARASAISCAFPRACAPRAKPLPGPMV